MEGSPEIDTGMLEIPEFSSIDSEKFKKDIVIPYFKDIYKVRRADPRTWPREATRRIRVSIKSQSLSTPVSLEF